MGERNRKGLTPKQARRAVRSLAYRRRLTPGIPTLENQLKAYLLSGDGKYTAKSKNGIRALLGGFLVKLQDGDIVLEKVDPVELDQLKFEFLTPGLEGKDKNFNSTTKDSK